MLNLLNDEFKSVTPICYCQLLDDWS